MSQPIGPEDRIESGEIEVRYSTTYLRTQGRRLRRSTLRGALFGLVASILLLWDGVHAWITDGMVDMGSVRG